MAKATTCLIAELLEQISDCAEMIQHLTTAGKFEAQFEEDKEKGLRMDDIMEDSYMTALEVQRLVTQQHNDIIGYEVREDVAGEYGIKLSRIGRKVKWNG